MARAASLDRNRIVTEAIALLNEEGLAQLSLRQLGKRLGVSAPSLARHVGDKGELLALMSTRIFGHALDRIPEGLTGADWLHAFGIALWQQQQETRDVAALISTAPPSAQTDRETARRLHDAMVRSGLSGERAMQAQQGIQALVTGYNTFAKSLRAPNFATSKPIEASFETSLDALIAGFVEEG